MLELVGQLRSMLAPQGVLAFTFFEPRYDRSLSDRSLPAGTDGFKLVEWELAKKPSPEIEGLIERTRQSNWFVLIDDNVYVEPGDEFCHQKRRGRPFESYCSFFTADYIASLFPDARVLPPVAPTGEWQHCCVLQEP